MPRARDIGMLIPAVKVAERLYGLRSTEYGLRPRLLLLHALDRIPEKGGCQRSSIRADTAEVKDDGHGSSALVTATTLFAANRIIHEPCPRCYRFAGRIKSLVTRNLHGKGDRQARLRFVLIVLIVLRIH